MRKAKRKASRKDAEKATSNRMDESMEGTKEELAAHENLEAAMGQNEPEDQHEMKGY